MISIVARFFPTYTYTYCTFDRSRLLISIVRCCISLIYHHIYIKFLRFCWNRCPFYVRTLIEVRKCKELILWFLLLKIS